MKSQSARPSALCLLLLAIGGNTASSQQTAPPPAQPSEVVQLSSFEVNATSDRGYGATQSISGSRINVAIQDLPASVVTITPRLMSDINPQEPSDAAKYIAGVNTATAKYGGQFTIRGYNIIGTNHRDGLPETSIVPTTGGGSTDLVGVERMEIIKGPAGILYGAHTMGGILNLVTKRPLPEFSATLKVSTGSWDYYRAEIDATGPVTKDKNLLFRIGAAYQDAELAMGLPYDRQAIAPYVEYRLGEKTRVWTRYYFLHANTASDTASWFTDVNQKFSTFMGQRAYLGESDEARDANYRNAEMGISTAVDAGASNWEFRLVGRFNSMSFAQTNYNIANYNMLNAAGAIIGRLGTNAAVATDSFSNPALARIVANRNRQYNPEKNKDGLVTMDIVGDFDIGPTQHKLLTNFEGTINDFSRIIYRWNYPDIDVTNITHVTGNPLSQATGVQVVANNKTNAHSFAWGVQENMTMLDGRVIVVGGARYDWRQQTDTNTFLNLGGVEETVSQWTYKFGVVGKLAKGMALFYNYSETFSPVVLRDVNNNQRFPNLIGHINEVGLKAELLESRLIATASYFDMLLENSTIFISDPNGGPGRLVAEGNATTRGWDLDLTAIPVKGLSLIAGIGDLSSRTDAGLRRRGVSQDISYKGFGTYEFQSGPLQGFTVGGGYEFANDRAGDTTDILKMPSYDLAEFMLAYRTKQWRFQMNVYNLLDEEFAFTSVNRNKIWPSEPRSFRVSAAFSF